MKKNSFVILIILFMPFNLLFSQFKMNYGIKAGSVYSHQIAVSYDNEFSYPSKWGLGAGVFFDGSFNKNISTLAEIDYLQEGWYSYNDMDVYQKYSRNVLSLSVMLKLKTNAGKFTPYLLAGPRFDFLLKMDSIEYSFIKNGNPIFGITFGLGCERVVWRDYSVLAEIRYNYDFDGMFWISSVGGLGSYNYNRALVFFVGVKF